jgi:hypothetical protein
MDWITSRFQDCLCSTCLKKVGTGDVELAPLKPSAPTCVEKEAPLERSNES